MRNLAALAACLLLLAACDNWTPAGPASTPGATPSSPGQGEDSPSGSPTAAPEDPSPSGLGTPLLPRTPAPDVRTPLPKPTDRITHPTIPGPPQPPVTDR